MADQFQFVISGSADITTEQCLGTWNTLTQKYEFAKCNIMSVFADCVKMTLCHKMMYDGPLSKKPA